VVIQSFCSTLHLSTITTQVSKLRDLIAWQGTAIQINNAHYPHIGSTVSDRLDDVLLQIDHLRSDMSTQIHQSYKLTELRVDTAINGISIQRRSIHNKIDTNQAYCASQPKDIDGPKMTPMEPSSQLFNIESNYLGECSGIRNSTQEKGSGMIIPDSQPGVELTTQNSSGLDNSIH
jgi:hypothetical protein